MVQKHKKNLRKYHLSLISVISASHCLSHIRISLSNFAYCLPNATF